jgi:hypothetical protein
VLNRVTPSSLSQGEIYSFDIDCRNYSSLSLANGWVPHFPDFLQRLVALIHSMRLSLMKGAHADRSSAAWQEIGVKPYFGLSGLPLHSTRFFVSRTEAEGLPSGTVF